MAQARLDPDSFENENRLIPTLILQGRLTDYPWARYRSHLYFRFHADTDLRTKQNRTLKFCEVMVTLLKWSHHETSNFIR